MVRSLLFCAALSTLLMGCDWLRPAPQVEEKPVYVSTHVPDSLLSCPAIPKANLQPEDQQDVVADYLTRLHAVAVECKSNLNGTATILKHSVPPKE